MVAHLTAVGMDGCDEKKKKVIPGRDGDLLRCVYDEWAVIGDGRLVAIDAW